VPTTTHYTVPGPADCDHHLHPLLQVVPGPAVCDHHLHPLLQVVPGPADCDHHLHPLLQCRVLLTPPGGLRPSSPPTTIQRVKELEKNIPLTKKDLEEMMAQQKEERKAEMDVLQKIFMQGVKEEMKEQLTAFRQEIRRELAEVREDVQKKVNVLEDKQNEMSDIQSIMDCRVDKMEEEMTLLKNLIGSQHTKVATEGQNAEIDDVTAKLVKHAMKVAGFKPIEHRDILRIKRMMNVEDDEEAKKLCLREFCKCEMRMPTKIIDELISNVKKIWNPANQDWDRLYVEFEDDKSVKVCFSYAKNLKDKDTQIMQYFSPAFSDQFRTLDATAYQLRHPDTPAGVKFKTRIRYGNLGLVLEKRHPDRKVWTKVTVPNLPPVDHNPVPPPTISTSPPTKRSRNKKRNRSPESSLDSSPTSEKNEKNSKVDEYTVDDDKIEGSFVFKDLVDKFGAN